MKRRVAVLGSTGSLGVQALEVAAAREDLEISALSGWRNVKTLSTQIERFKPKVAAVGREEDAAYLRRRCGSTRILSGVDSLCEVAGLDGTDVVAVCVTGLAGMAPALAALRAGKIVALANKESVVAGGHLLVRAARENGATLVPVDSEHTALFRLTRGNGDLPVEKIVLTASGGPFQDLTHEELSRVTPQTALQHPVWRMGRMITINSATLMNKGYEVIEVHWLLGTAFDGIDVVIHPEAVVHGFVQLSDGALIGYLAPPDMRLSLDYALSYPSQKTLLKGALDLPRVGTLSFTAPDCQRFPCLRLALEAAETGGTMTTALVAANEVAVERFLDNRLRFTDIPRVIEKVLAAHDAQMDPDVQAICQTAAWARREALDCC